MFRSKISVFFLFCICYSYAQTDTTQLRGTIKIGKIKDAVIYIKAVVDFNNFKLPEVNHDFSKDELFQPFPVVEGYPFPFNYNNYFKDCFRSKNIDLKEKKTDTVFFEVKILANGKAYFKDKSSTLIVNGSAVVYNSKMEAFELNNLHLNCLSFLKEIKQWFPAYIVFPKKSKFKGQTVIKLNKKNVDASGTILILFSKTPFED